MASGASLELVDEGGYSELDRERVLNTPPSRHSISFHSQDFIKGNRRTVAFDPDIKSPDRDHLFGPQGTTAA